MVAQDGNSALHDLLCGLPPGCTVAHPNAVVEQLAYACANLQFKPPLDAAGAMLFHLAAAFGSRAGVLHGFGAVYADALAYADQARGPSPPAGQALLPTARLCQR